jgi:hypothetical protein
MYLVGNLTIPRTGSSLCVMFLQWQNNRPSLWLQSSDFSLSKCTSVEWCLVFSSSKCLSDLCKFTNHICHKRKLVKHIRSNLVKLGLKCWSRSWLWHNFVFLFCVQSIHKFKPVLSNFQIMYFDADNSNFTVSMNCIIHLQCPIVLCLFISFWTLCTYLELGLCDNCEALVDFWFWFQIRVSTLHVSSVPSLLWCFYTTCDLPPVGILFPTSGFGRIQGLNDYLHRSEGMWKRCPNLVWILVIFAVCVN